MDGAQNISNCVGSGMSFSFDFTTSVFQKVLVNHGGGASCTPSAGAYSNLDPVTFVSTAPHPTGQSGMRPIIGMDGQLYGLKTGAGSLYKLNANNTWTLLMGTGTAGQCADGLVLATACPIDATDYFITKTGAYYVMDRGRIRTMDETGKMVTIYGQNASTADGKHPLRARIGAVNNIVYAGNALAYYDSIEARIREFSTSSATPTVATLAGNGGSAVTALSPTLAVNTALTDSISGLYLDHMVTDPSDGSIYVTTLTTGATSNPKIVKLDRAAGTWSTVSGNSGGTDFFNAADGTVGTSIRYTLGYSPRVLGFDSVNKKLLIHVSNYVNATATHNNAHFNFANLLDSAKQYLAAGTSTIGNNVTTDCPNGPATSCNLLYSGTDVYSQSEHDDVSDRWLFVARGSNMTNVKVLAAGNISDLQNDSGGTVATSVTINHIAYYHTASAHKLFYCGKADGKLHKLDLKNAPHTDTLLSWPIPSISCAGHSMVYDSTNDRLLFIYMQNGLYGIAEYLSP